MYVYNYSKAIKLIIIHADVKNINNVMAKLRTISCNNEDTSHISVQFFQNFKKPNLPITRASGLELMI